MQLGLHEPAAAAAAAGAHRAAAFAQPALREHEGELQRTDAVRAVQHQRVATLMGQRLGQWFGQPGQRQGAVLCGHQA